MTGQTNSGRRARRSATTRRFEIHVSDEQRVSAEARRPAGFHPDASPGLVLAHGAGNDMHSPFLRFCARELGRELLTLRFNFIYKELGRRAPDRAPRLEATYTAAIEHLATHADLRPRPLFIGGKSMGGRIASHLAAGGRQVAELEIGGLVLLGYPLHPAGKPEKLRDRHLAAIRCPMLFIQGSRDRLCEPALLRRTLRKLRAPHRLHVIEEGDHSFRVPKRTGRAEHEIWEEICATIVDWMTEVA